MPTNVQNGANHLPALPQEINIDPAWLDARDTVLDHSKSVVAVESQQDYTMAEIALKQLTSTSNSMESFRKKFGAPFLAATKKIKAIADASRDPLEEEKTRIKLIMKAYLVEQERLRRIEEARVAKIESDRLEAERVKLEEAAKSDDPFAEMVAEEEAEDAKRAAPIVVEKPLVHKTMSAVKHDWDFEIMNPNNVPREYCVPSEALIRSAVKKGGARDIPGVRIFEDIKVRSR